MTASRSDSRFAGRLFWRTKYLRPFGSVAVRTAVSNGIVAWRLGACAARLAAAASAAHVPTNARFFMSTYWSVVFLSGVLSASLRSGAFQSMPRAYFISHAISSASRVRT